MPQHAVTNGYRNIEYLRPQLSTASTVVVMNESPPWRRNSSARASFTRLASSRDTGLGIALRIESTGIVLALCAGSGGQTRRLPTLRCARGLPWTIALPDGQQRRADDPTRQALAWSVHLFTASGAVLAVFALWEIGRGGFARAAIYMLAALAIDSVDGTLARRVGVAERLPRIDGRRLDDVVDYPELRDRAGGVPARAGRVRPLERRGAARARERVRVRPGRREDRGRLLPRLALLLERRRALRVAARALARGGLGLGGAVRARSIFVPLKYIYPSKLRRLRAVTAVGGIALGDARWR